MTGSLGSTKDAFSGETGGANQAGVGIFFQQESDGRVYVKTIVSGGSAERDKTIRIGDVIVKVDDREVVGEALPVLRSLILGAQGTFVKLTFGRAVGDSIQYYDVRLMRGTAEYFAALDASYRRQGELDTLRIQLREALASGAQEHEELERVKKLLQMERETAHRREQEYDTMQREQSENLLQHTELLRRAEQGRREVELQLMPVAQREQDLTEELNRQREKDMLRKEYIEELKKRHDDEKARLAALVGKEQRARREDQIERMNAESQLQKSQTDLVRLRETDKLRRSRDEEAHMRFDQERQRLAEVVMNQETVRQQIREVEARLAQFYQEHFGGSQPMVAPSPAKSVPAPAAPAPAPENPNDEFFLA
eukprot:CAMPEP_0175847942 /NCGR_PEP_ID=MMETSP0107_2-20121207/23637_1 /TAXON_ID=195067 ORGANISM="Goniomonas pacifica, Strain CCMP1869" /NCGR_SAMPLE_ID=MMETSP0107_2 /ASSEMBLY_ACC=CAM_ASM_000203 /LENGTH=367 /DNA_ID=CAMNT_0017162821 /DNA_START=7 /DNA_END=1110 /DNA_ORIENTATION=-